MNDLNHIKINLMVIGLVVTISSVFVYQIYPYYAIIPPGLAISLFLINMRIFNLSFKELFSGVEQKDGSVE